MQSEEDQVTATGNMHKNWWSSAVRFLSYDQTGNQMKSGYRWYIKIKRWRIIPSEIGPGFLYVVMEVEQLFQLVKLWTNSPKMNLWGLWSFFTSHMPSCLPTNSIRKKMKLLLSTYIICDSDHPFCCCMIIGTPIDSLLQLVQWSSGR